MIRSILEHISLYWEKLNCYSLKSPFDTDTVIRTDPIPPACCFETSASLPEKPGPVDAKCGFGRYYSSKEKSSPANQR